MFSVTQPHSVVIGHKGGHQGRVVALAREAHWIISSLPVTKNYRSVTQSAQEIFCATSIMDREICSKSRRLYLGLPKVCPPARNVMHSHRIYVTPFEPGNVTHDNAEPKTD
jgi:hypothetical protein